MGAPGSKYNISKDSAPVATSSALSRRHASHRQRIHWKQAVCGSRKNRGDAASGGLRARLQPAGQDGFWWGPAVFRFLRAEPTILSVFLLGGFMADSRIKVKNYKKKIKLTKIEIEKFKDWEAPKHLAELRQHCIKTLKQRICFLEYHGNDDNFRK